MFNCETEKRKGGNLESVLWFHGTIEKAAILNVFKKIRWPVEVVNDRQR